MKEVDEFYFDKSEPYKGCLLALRKIILSHDENISETIKYGMPCFCYKKKIMCYLWTDNKTSEPYILVVDGNQLDIPELEKGNRSRMKILRLDSMVDLPLTLIQSILDAMLDLYKDKISLETKDQ